LNVFDLNSEVFIGEESEPSIEDAQADASTLDEDQDDDPETSSTEKARVWRLLDMNPLDSV
jgi:hypothetical protein